LMGTGPSSKLGARAPHTCWPACRASCAPAVKERQRKHTNSKK
jgi:hypothetical protein